MRETIQIRRVRPEEYDAVGAMVRAAYAGDYTLNDEYLAEIEDVAGRDEVSEVLVAVDRGTGDLLGTITLPRAGERLIDDTAENEFDVRLLGVSRAARGRGVGRAIMRHAADVARSRGLDRVVLHTGEQMLAAQRLYERMGFVQIPEREFTIERDIGPLRILSYGLDVDRVTA
ncbi:GNAT family N-acetyltransferase [Leucobacter chromiiresistens]|uniref:Ribosomal protein S18 acetylase RimI n=1 Tax=Leucobacter chromiiresistens TaxID=1079994 RepID=A0A1H0YWG5_9MICO|nr:GNAT family N-acetyltransferase [Leucobacter chromiiresistens]SDQ19196.1 Ribosomal protein S18 acetylase RimI [Leucobacter chromiiresistens]